MGVPRIGSRHRGRELSQDEQFRRFVTDYLPTLLRGAYLLLRDFDLAEDAVQGTLLRVFRRWNEAQVAPESYSRAALISVCQDYWRWRGRRPKEVLSADVTVRDEHVAFSDGRDDREVLDQALGALPRPQREVLVLRFFFDLSVSQTAELLDMPEGTVKSTTHRGLQQLRNLLSSPSDEANAC